MRFSCVGCIVIFGFCGGTLLFVALFADALVLSAGVSSFLFKFNKKSKFTLIMLSGPIPSNIYTIMFADKNKENINSIAPFEATLATLQNITIKVTPSLTKKTSNLTISMNEVFKIYEFSN